ncbi:MAG: helix-turn-helix domain-containing protein [Leptolyngbya sp. RL_3_1]|nr:helix-turn-helix domain-containing protein [Leptolyngbya sp. RL_3_1]
MDSASGEGQRPVPRDYRLRPLMTAAHLPSFIALAQAAGVSIGAITRLRQGKIAQMQLATVGKIAQALGLSITVLQQCLAGDADAIAAGDGTAAAARDRIATLEAEYERLQAQLTSQQAQARQALQQEALGILEPWLLQWPTVTHAVRQNPDLPASRLVPLVKPVEALLTHWGIEAIAIVGAEVPYDPQRHQLMGGTAAPGETVRVRYSGYTQGKRLLHRAKVSLP